MKNQNKLGNKTAQELSKPKKIGFQNKAYQKIRFWLYALVIVLINLSVAFHSIRSDLTEQKTFTLAEASKSTVARLEEPVTIRAYLSDNLPSTYNILSSKLRDLLQTYQGYAQKGKFSYSVNIMANGDSGTKNKKLEKEASQYGIYPVPLQGSNGNEFKALSAYLGLVITQAENQELISLLNPNVNLQYEITAALNKMSRKSTALLSLQENLKVYYYFSPLVGKLEKGQYANFPKLFQEVIANTAEQLYGRVESKVVDPATLPPGLPQPGELNLAKTEIADQNGTNSPVYSAIVIDNGGKYQAFSLLQMQPRLQLGPNGLTQENVINVISPKDIENQIADLIISTLGIAQNIGYIADRETASFDQPDPRAPQGQSVNLSLLKQRAEGLYNFQAVNLDEGISREVNILMIVDPMKQLSDWDLYQIDQFVMRGGRLIVAMQPYQIVQPRYGGPPQFIPNPNINGIKESDGTNKNNFTLLQLLKHYGFVYQDKLVLDKNSYIQRGTNPQTGAYQENQFYFVPEISTKWGSDISFIKNLSRFLFMNSAPLMTLTETPEDTEQKEASPQDYQPFALVKTSPEAWTEDMSTGNKNLNNLLPPPNDELAQYNLLMATPKGAKINSFFVGKDIPNPPDPTSETKDDQATDSESKDDKLTLAGIRNEFIPEGEYGQILVSGSSLIFDQQLMGFPPNAALALNLLDYMADNQPMAELRGRSGAPNIIDKNVSNTLKNFIKWFNVLGLPAAVGILGIIMLLNWRRRQAQLCILFASEQA